MGVLTEDAFSEGSASRILLTFFDEFVDQQNHCFILADVKSKAVLLEKTLMVLEVIWRKHTPIVPPTHPDGEHVVETP